MWTQEQTLVASPIISLRASSPGRYRVAVRRDATVMTSAEFFVKPAPTIAATGSLKAGFPLNVNLGGFLDPTDRVRIDTLGQADLCAACTDPTINKPAAPTVTFDNTPAAGTYQVRLLRRDQTIALQTITIEPLPNPTLTAWVITKADPLNPNPRPECKTIWAANVGRSRYRWTKIEPVYTQIFDIATGQTIYTLANDAFAIESYACPVIPTAEAHPYGYGYGPGDTGSRSFFWQVTNYAPASGETLTIELGPGKALVTKGDCGPLPGWCSGISHNIDIVDIPQNNFATRVVQTRLHTDFAGLRDTVIGGFALAFKNIQLNPGTACVLPYEQWPPAIRATDYGAFHIPVPPTGNCADAITTNIFIAVDTNGVVVPGQQNPDGTWKTITTNPILAANPDPHAPPEPVLASAPVGAHYFQHGVSTPIESAVVGPEGSLGCITSVNSGFGFGFGQVCTEFVPFQNTDLSWQLWVLGADGLTGCLSRSPDGTAALSPTCSGEVDFTDNPKIDLRFQISILGNCLEANPSSQSVKFAPCSNQLQQFWYDAESKVSNRPGIAPGQVPQRDKALQESLKQDARRKANPFETKRDPLELTTLRGICGGIGKVFNPYSRDPGTGEYKPVFPEPLVIFAPGTCQTSKPALYVLSCNRTDLLSWKSTAHPEQFPQTQITISGIIKNSSTSFTVKPNPLNEELGSRPVACTQTTGANGLGQSADEDQPDTLPPTGGLINRVRSRLASIAKALNDLSILVDEIIASSLNKWGDLTEASKYGFQKYRDLVKLNLPGLQRHHVIEQRLAPRMGENPDDMISIVVTPEEHNAFTQAWRQKIGYTNSTNPLIPSTNNATRSDIVEASLEIYKDYPAIVERICLLYPSYC